MIIHLSLFIAIFIGTFFGGAMIRQYKTPCAIDHGHYYEKSMLLPWLIVFGYIAFLAAMRSAMNDTTTYIESFKAVEATWENLHEQLSNGDSRYRITTATTIIFKMYISDNYHWWFASYAIIESVIFIHVLRREAVSYFDACFFFVTSTLYYNYFSMMRQWLAVAITFAGIMAIREKKAWKYLLLCVIAAQFHPSAYACVVFFFLASGKAWSKKQNILIMAAFVGLFFLQPILNRLEDTLGDSTYGYAISAMADSNGSSIIRAFIALVPVALAYVTRNGFDQGNRVINFCVNMSVINFLLNLLASFTSGLFVIRLATYTAVFNVILYPYVLNVAISRRNREFLRLAFYVLYFALYFYQMNHQGAWGYKSDILIGLSNY